VTGAAGAVGSAAIELIHARGGLVIALVKDARDETALDKTKAQAITTSETGNLGDVVRAATNGNGAGVALNGIGRLGCSHTALFARARMANGGLQCRICRTRDAIRSELRPLFENARRASRCRKIPAREFRYRLRSDPRLDWQGAV